MDNATYDEEVGGRVREALETSGLSVLGTSRDSGIPYSTLDRKLRGITSFSVSELRRIGLITGRSAGSFLPDDSSELIAV